MPPVVAAIGALGAAIGAGFTSLAAALGLTAGQLGLAALSLAASILLRPKPPSVPSPEDGKVNLRQPTPPLRRAYGTVDRGGDYYFYRNRAGIAYQGLIPTLGPIDSFIAWKLHDEYVDLDTNGYVTLPHFYKGEASQIGGPENGLGSRVRIFSQTGRPDVTVYSALASAFPEVCDAGFRLPGLASLLVLAQTVEQSAVSKVYPQGLPQPGVRLRGALIYDPRDSEQDPDDDPSDPVTWAYSETPTLCALDYLRHWSGYNKPRSKIYMPEFIASADIDDRLELGFDGTYQRRYRMGGCYDLGDTPRKTVLAAILQTADLWIYQRIDGKIGIKGGDWYEPTVRITEADIIGLRVESFDAITEQTECLRGKFTSAAHKYSTVEAYAWPDGADPRATAETAKAIERPWVQNHRQMRLLLQIEYDRMNAPKRGKAVISGRRLDIFGERFAILHVPSRRLYNATIELDAPPAWTDRDQLAFSWRLVTPERYILSPSAEGPAPVVKVFENDAGIPNVEDFDVVISAEDVGGILRPYAVFTWAAAESGMTQQIEIYRVGVEDSEEYIRTEDEVVTAQSGFLLAGTNYRFRIRNLTASDKKGNWSSFIFRTATVGVDPPGSPALTLATVNAATSASGTLTAPNAASLSKLRLYRVAHGAALDLSAPPAQSWFAVANQVIDVTDSPAGGDWDYYATAVDIYSGVSAPAGPIALTIVAALAVDGDGNVLDAGGGLTLDPT